MHPKGRNEMIPAVSQENTFAVPGIANTIAIRILRSPLHGLLSHNTLLLSFQGRKSGKIYTKPRHGWLADPGNHPEGPVSFFPGSIAMKHCTYLQPKQTCH